jgi:hypothetical protein
LIRSGHRNPISIFNRREDRRYFVVGFRTGAVRAVYPSDDPLVYDLQIVTKDVVAQLEKQLEMGSDNRSPRGIKALKLTAPLI